MLKSNDVCSLLWGCLSESCEDEWSNCLSRADFCSHIPHSTSQLLSLDWGTEAIFQLFNLSPANRIPVDPKFAFRDKRQTEEKLEAILYCHNLKRKHKGHKNPKGLRPPAIACLKHSETGMALALVSWSESWESAFQLFIWSLLKAPHDLCIWSSFW